jgi:GNAT superfamily N-acetyltransferase
VSPFTIREATPLDLAVLADAHRDSIQTLGPSFYPPQAVADWQAGITPDLYLNAMRAGEVFFLAVQDGLVLGFSSDYAIDGTIHGASVYVRGSAARQGVGSALLLHAEVHAIAAGATCIEVDASLAAVDFYAVNGFTELGRGDTVLTTGRSIATVFMRKTLKIHSAGEGPTDIS